MDKRNQDISIKINGKEHRVSEKGQEEPKYTPNVEKKQKYPQFKTNEEIAAAREEEEDEFNWVLPDESIKNHSNRDIEIPVIPIEDLRKTKGSTKIPYLAKKSKGIQVFTLKQFLVSVIMAVVLGTGFGVMILKIVGDVGSKPVVQENPLPSQENPGQAPGSNDKEEPKTNEGVSIELENLATGMVQGGRYSTAENASTVVNQIKSGGFAATVVELDGAYFVFAGIGADQEAVKSIDAEYESTNPDFFSKTIELPGGSFSNATKGDSKAIANSLPVFKELVSLSSEAFGSGTLSEEQWKKVTSLYETMKNSKQENLHDDMKDFTTNITSSYKSLQGFKSNGDKKALWQSQQSLLDAYQNYSKWVSQLK